MAQYVLSENAARKFKQLTTSKIKTSSRIAHSPQHGIDNYYPTPFQVQWAQSSGEKNEDGTYKGTYIIWIPNGALRINKKLVTSYNIKKAENYTSSSEGGGWYDLTVMFDDKDYIGSTNEWPEEFHVWIDYSGIYVSFHFADKVASIQPRILIATVKNKNVKQIVNSAIIVEDVNKPFDIVTVNIETSSVPYIIRNEFYDANHELTHLSAVPLKLDESATTMNAFLVNRLTIDDSKSAISSKYSIEFTKENAEPEASQNTNADQRNFMYWKKLYTYSAKTGIPVIDYRDAVVEMNWTGVDNNTVSYGDDGQYKSFLHLANFYNQQADVSSIEDQDEILIRRGNALSAYLGYAPLNALKDKLSDDLSANIKVDNASISKGFDGQLSNTLHLYNFHNNNGMTTTMAYSDILLRTKSEASGLEPTEISNTLEYISYKDFEDIVATIALSVVKDNNISSLPSDGLNALSAELSAISTGSFHYDQSSRTIRNGAIMIGRRPILVSGTAAKTGYMSLEVSIADGGSATWINEAVFNRYSFGATSYIPVYRFDSDLKVIGDYRGCFNVPCYE